MAHSEVVLVDSRLSSLEEAGQPSYQYMRRLWWINSPKSLRGLCARLNPIVEQFVLVVKRIRMNPAHIQKEMKLHMFVQSQFLIK